MNDMEQQINQMNQMSQEHMNNMQQPIQGQPMPMQQPVQQAQMVAPTGVAKPSKRGKRKGGVFSNIYDKMNEIGNSKAGKIIVPIILIGIIAFFWIGWGGNFMALFDGKFGN